MTAIHHLPASSELDVERLAEFISVHRGLCVLTGAGCSTESGIPDYRGPQGTWSRRKPMQYAEFMRSEISRRHYWARNYRGWPVFDSARPNATHYALATLEQRSFVDTLITQNVDPLHRRAGSRRLIELHGQSDRVVCVDCGARSSRLRLQQRMTELNTRWLVSASEVHPDADAEIERELTSTFTVPPCEACSGRLKPDVVFFGENVPPSRVQDAMQALERATALVVAGSSLTVWSGYRFALRASELQKPIAIVNFGQTRADDLATLRVAGRCGDLLSRVTAVLDRETGVPAARDLFP